MSQPLMPHATACWLIENTALSFPQIADFCGLHMLEVQATVAELIAWLKTRGPEFANAFDQAEVIRTAIDQAHVHQDAKIGEAREIAFFPPVTGG